MKLRRFTSNLPVGCLRVYVRVDWNIPLGDGLGAEESLKLTRSYRLLEELRQAGAIVLVLTHLGRPKGRELKYSTKPLAKIVSAHSGLSIQYLDVDLSTTKGREAYARDLDRYQPGDIALLENVRFQKGEETNAAALVKAYAEHGDMFINDAFASCHRSHVSVAGLAKALPSFAGPSLCAEVDALSHLMSNGHTVKHPYVAIIGGAKLSTKIPVLRALLKMADKVLVGGAMAHAFMSARRQRIGKSFIEKGAATDARKLMSNRKLVTPIDVVVSKKLQGGSTRAVKVTEVKKDDIIVDIGPETMRSWASEIRKAKTVVWNGPLGLTEVPSFSHGSLVIGRAIASRAKGSTYGVAGGGDTLPVLQRTGMHEYFDFISTGGGAMLEFLSEHGKLPGIIALQGVQQKKIPKLPRVSKEVGISCAPEAPPVRPAKYKHSSGSKKTPRRK